MARQDEVIPDQFRDDLEFYQTARIDWSATEYQRRVTNKHLRERKTQLQTYSCGYEFPYQPFSEMQRLAISPYRSEGRVEYNIRHYWKTDWKWDDEGS